MAMLAATEGVVTTMPEALINTGLGMGTVFIVLIFISFVIALLPKLTGLIENAGKKKEAAPAPAAAPTAPVVSSLAPLLKFS